MGEGLFEPMHLILILVIVMIIFGAGKLPEIGGAMGKSIKEFKQSVGDTADAAPQAHAIAAIQAPTPTTKLPVRPADIPGIRADEL
jgi:sec-independent protein translocase protein TatA